MIRVHRLNGEEFLLNEHHIELAEAKPDTVITLTNDRKYIIRETIQELIELIRAEQVEFMRRFHEAEKKG
jgi:flagellar protein FlbD